MNQSVRTFALVGIIVSILLLMHALPSLSIGGTELRKVNLLSDISPYKLNETDVEVVPRPAPPKSVLTAKVHGKRVEFKEIWPKGVTPIIDYSGGSAGGMDHFYQALTAVGKLNKPVRIAYFGDSFIEGDILTCDLREMFQQKFGGSGVGWIDCAMMSGVVRRTVTQKSSGLTAYSVVKKPFDRTRQGINERYFIPSEGAMMTATGTRYKSKSTHWDVARLFLRTSGGLQVTVTGDASNHQSQCVQPLNGVQETVFRNPTNSIRYRFNDIGVGTYLFGASLESDRGVILDNLSTRGSNGLTLRNIPIGTLKDFAWLRSYDLIIVGFGLNVAVHGNPDSVMKLYTKNMGKAIDHLREAFPQASILVMSVSDRDGRSADGIRTLKEVEHLTAFQQQMAATTKVSFLNLYQAMGGAGSMKRLVDKRMANKDYAHLSYGGGAYVAQKVFSSFTAGLENYKRRITLEKQ